MEPTLLEQLLLASLPSLPPIKLCRDISYILLYHKLKSIVTKV